MSPRGVPNPKPETDDVPVPDETNTGPKADPVTARRLDTSIADRLRELAAQHADSLHDWLSAGHHASESDAEVYDTLNRAADLLS